MDDIIATTITPYTRVNKVDVPGISATYYYEKDHLGSVIKITSSTGSVIDEYSYTVFGKAYKKNTLGVYKPLTSIKSDIGNTRLYTGREYDRETNLYYLRARYYDSNLGRFISRDPIGMKDNVNLYSYVANSSVGYVDRMGTASKSVLIIGFLGKYGDLNGEVNKDLYQNSGIGLALNGFSDNSKVETKLFYSSKSHPGSGIDPAYEYIMENKKKYKTVILLGHSIGADNVVELSEMLYQKSIPVDLLVTIDLQAYWDTTTLHSNVLNANNYYQDSGWIDPDETGITMLNPSGALLDREPGNVMTNLQNIDASEYCNIEKCPNAGWEETFYHTTLDNGIARRVIRDINNFIK